MHVTAEPGESFDRLLRRFLSGVKRAGIVREVRRRRQFHSPAERRRWKRLWAERRARQRRAREMA